MEFDKNRVFTSVNADEVKVGSIGYFADTYAELLYYVSSDKQTKTFVYRILDGDCIRRFSCATDLPCYSAGTPYEQKYLLFYLLEEPKEVKEEYRPYNNIEEFIKDYCDRVGIEAHSLVRPVIWVKSSSDMERMVTEYAFADNTVRLGGHERFWYELKDLFEQFTYLDGSKCGIKEK